MRRASILSGPALLGLAACASTPPAAGPPSTEDAMAVRPVEASLSSLKVDDVPVASSKGAPAELLDQEDGSAGPGPDSAFEADELALWRSPAFQRRFTQSYLAETEIEPRVTEPERELLQEVLDDISSDRADRAVKRIERERTDASSPVFDFLLGSLAFQREDLDTAAAAYSRAVDRFPKFRRAWQNLGFVRVRQSDFPGAAEAFTKVLELGGGDGTTYGLLGYASANLGRHMTAESAYRMAALLDPETRDWKMGLARTFFEQKRWADAVALCGDLIEENPDSADLWLLQANAFVGQGEVLRAAENFELVDRLGRSTPESLWNLGDIYVNEQLFELGVDAYLRGIALGPGGEPDRAVRAAKVLAAHGALPEMRTLIDGIEDGFGRGADGSKGASEGAPAEGSRKEGAAAGLDVEARKDLLKLRARLAAAEGGGEEEARVLERIVALDPLDGEALILLGLHASRAGDVEKAIFWYERAATLEDHEAEAKVRHAQVLVGLGRYEEALPLLRRAQALEPRDNIQKYLEQVERISQRR